MTHKDTYINGCWSKFFDKTKVMENNYINKQLFFAAYWGQKIIKYSNSPFITTVNEHSCQEWNDCFLELTPLSHITEEDAISVANLQAPTFDTKSKILRFDDRVEVHRLNFMVQIGYKISVIDKCLLLYMDGENQNIYPYDSLIFIDYMRQRGYALPFMGLSVEELVNRGWAKLKTN